MKIEGLEDLIKALDQASARVPNAKRRYLRIHGELLNGRVKKNTPVKTTLRRESWHVKPLNDDTVIIYNNVYYACYVEDDHRLKDRKGNWIKDKDGKYKIVKGAKMLRRGLIESRRTFATDSKAIMNMIFKG